MISIIIIVKNDRKIAFLLNELKNIKKPEKTEVLIVDASEGQLDDIKNKYSYTKWIPFINKTKKKTTIPDQRNVGIANAKGNIIVFIDSDCIPHKDWLMEITRPILVEKEKICAGRVILNDKKNIHNIEHNKILNKKYINECPTMNVALQKDIYKKVGLYDESFLFGSDMDFSWRAIKKGYKIRLNPKAIIYHDLGDPKNELRRMYDYGKAWMHLFKKHTYKRKQMTKNIIFNCLYTLYFIFLPLTYAYPYYPFLILIPIIKNWNNNPKRIIIHKTFYGLGLLKELIVPET